jgi:T-complex protein 1 subunit delta
LKQLEVVHPCAKMLVDLAHAQDVEAGDGTTTVTVLAGALLGAVQQLLARGVHPTTIAESFLKAATKSEEILESIATPVKLDDRETLLKNASTSLNSKVIEFSSS